jgi:ribonuclease Z
MLEAAFLGDAPRAFSGPIRVAEDGLLISLPAGSTAIDQQVIR